jgi:hypothetical protein
MAREAGVPVLVVAGSLGEGWESMQRLVDGIALTPSPSPVRGRGGSGHAEALVEATERAVREWSDARTNSGPR